MPIKAPKGYLTLREAAERMKLHRITIYKLIRDGYLKPWTPGKHPYLSIKVVDSFLGHLK